MAGMDGYRPREFEIVPDRNCLNGRQFSSGRRSPSGPLVDGDTEFVLILGLHREVELSMMLVSRWWSVLGAQMVNQVPYSN